MLENQLLLGDALEVLKTLPGSLVQTVVISPPYFGLRSYLPDGHPDQFKEIGKEETLAQYIERLIKIFREIRRILKADGTLWLNLGDLYAGTKEQQRNNGDKQKRRRQSKKLDKVSGLAKKNLLGVPWRVAFALQDDGWILRSDVIWHKPNCTPENVKDRPTKSHEFLFLFTKSRRYFYDAEAIREPHTMKPQRRLVQRSSTRNAAMRSDKKYLHTIRAEAGIDGNPAGRNKRTVWSIPTQSYKGYKGIHFAVMPEHLAEICILAGSAPGNLVLDPFIGTGTVAVVAARHGRNYLGIDLNPEYLELARERLAELM